MKKKLQTRYHGLDFCRSTFMILGIFYHVGLIYSNNNDWRVLSTETSSLITKTTNYLHLFRMEAFYLISGFFFILVLKKSKDNFLADRLKRVLIPLLFCGLFINPIMNSFSYNFTFSNDFKYILYGEWLGHLWFLGNLSLYFITSYLFRNTIKKAENLNFLLIGLTVVPIFSCAGLFISKFIYKGNFLFFSIDKLLYFYCYFLLGCIAYQNINSFIKALNYKTVILCTFSILILLNLRDYYFHLDNIGSKVITKYISTLLTITAIAFLYNIGSRESLLTGKISRASYTIYLLHQPLIIVLYVFIFSKTAYPAWVEYSLIVTLTYFPIYFFHIRFVERIDKLRFLLNGFSGNK